MSKKQFSDQSSNLRGSLKRYANPARIEQEQDAWQAVVEDTFDYTQWRQTTDTDDSIEDISRKAMELRRKQDNVVS